MVIKIDKIIDLDYDETIALSVIEQDKDLNEIFSEDINMSYNLLRTLSKEDKLSQETKELIKDIFDNVILTKKEFVDKYKSLLEQPLTSEETKKEEPTKNPNKLPRRYGKKNIMVDIKKQEGKATNAQLTALAVNDLKNIYANLNNRLVNDMLTDNPILSDEDYRTIRATITIVKNKLREILKKK